MEFSKGDKPTGPYAKEMTGQGAWPETSESQFSDRALQLGAKQVELIRSAESWGSHMASIFNGDHVWSGTGAIAAGAEVRQRAMAVERHQQQFNGAIAWCNEASGHIVSAKDAIRANVRAGQKDVDVAIKNAADTKTRSTEAIQAIVNRKFYENFATVNDLAVSLGGEARIPGDPPFPEAGMIGKGREAGAQALMQTSEVPRDVPVAPLPGKSAIKPAMVLTDTPSAVPEMPSKAPVSRTPSMVTTDVPQATPPPPGPSPSTRPSAPSIPSVGGPTPSLPSPGGSPSLPGMGGTPSAPSSPSISAPSPLSAPTSPASAQPATAVAASGPHAGIPPQTPAQAFTQAFNEAANAGPQVQAASAGHASAPAAPLQETLSQSAGHAAGVASSTVPTGNAAPAVPVSGSSAPGAAMPAIPPPMPLGPPATPTPAAPTATAPVVPSSTPGASSSNSGSVVGAAPVPVSAARAERDAIATASAAGALQRKAKGNNPTQMARRIAAALNADQSADFGFHWMTAVAADGTIVVANSYGIAFIPEGVNLPEQVKMASADETISAGDRGRWATYPALMLQGWAQLHGVALRQIIATEVQFQGFDPGAAKVVLQPDDIPAKGQMVGRSRLEVIAPETARRLAAVPDTALTELLPAAPTDVNPPADETFSKWFEVMKPLMSSSPDRGVAHLRAFVDYADHAQGKSLFMAHTAMDPSALRAAIADWVYWQHLSVLVTDALSGLQTA